jgi:hypothetical protein
VVPTLLIRAYVILGLNQDPVSSFRMSTASYFHIPPEVCNLKDETRRMSLENPTSPPPSGRCGQVKACCQGRAFCSRLHEKGRDQRGTTLCHLEIAKYSPARIITHPREPETALHSDLGAASSRRPTIRQGSLQDVCTPRLRHDHDHHRPSLSLCTLPL